ncbi:unnamed protein product [Danaus chrysippus]|uniref:(African queen) hypothetical protein n=1 Tax=Danaus chrysippus TaxID=151541 RepID=A0A8J2VXC1_9NEOP|nr:unnamed protein product [Danaus chrysippus]
MTILKQAVKIVEQLPKVKWIFLADDDTILGVQRLREILTCYRGGYDITVIAERYGYGYGKKNLRRKSIVESNHSYIPSSQGIRTPRGRWHCPLYRRGSRSVFMPMFMPWTQPDDMALGACAARRNITITHSPLFHQARPPGLSPGGRVLARGPPRVLPPPVRSTGTGLQYLVPER